MAPSSRVIPYFKAREVASMHKLPALQGGSGMRLDGDLHRSHV